MVSKEGETIDFARVSSKDGQTRSCLRRSKAEARVRAQASSLALAETLMLIGAILAAPFASHRVPLPRLSI